mmetsp:Transcript_57729/g.69440  ORF Transcript_57729/g.69440 Transcript_57729/m.69440 type:complete len:269 (+) Transcript_57729:154-960(+)
MNHVVPMVCASMFSILGGGSLGPEAPLVAICAALGGFVSRRVFKQRSRNVVRKHTLMGMAGALAAFFGSPLGGSLFALEVNSRFGIEYFEHTVEAIFSGEVCLVVFRALSGLPIGSIWIIAKPTLASANPVDVLTGAFIGLLGAGVAACFSSLHFKVMDVFGNMGLLVNSRAVYRGLLGGSVIVLLGMLIPHTMVRSLHIFSNAILRQLRNLSHHFFSFITIFLRRSITFFIFVSCVVLGRIRVPDHSDNGTGREPRIHSAYFWFNWI